MDSIGAEVGQKMRSAIKAKLLELECYVDDELPDYIMVMVANKRTKSQMNEDLNLFLSTKTSAFVNWLHIVLKKLKEVTVTNPEVYKKVTKRKSNELSDSKLKKEKRDKKVKRENNEDIKPVIKNEQAKSLTDDLPITATKLSEQRKIILQNESKFSDSLMEDTFDIPLLSEVHECSEKELEDIERKIRNVKSRLGLIVESGDENDNDFEDLKAMKDALLKRRIQKECEELESSQENFEKSPKDRGCNEESVKNSLEEKKKEHTKIVFEESTTPPRRTSVLERLGKRSVETTEDPPRKKISLSEYRKEEEKYLGYSKSSDRKGNEVNRDHYRNSFRDGGAKDKSSRTDTKESKKRNIYSRLGVRSKISVPQKPIEESEEEEEVHREVASLIKVKPRTIPANAPQANKNLLLKAVADAQKSIAQTPTVGNNIKPDALFTKNYKEKTADERSRRISLNEKNKLRHHMVQGRNRTVSSESEEFDSDGEYIPKPVKKPQRQVPEYVPSSKRSESEELKQQFRITLDLSEGKLRKNSSVKSRLDGRKTPSPIVFDKQVSISPVAKPKPNIPDKLPIVHPPISVKNKERCKYWPNCRHGDKCEFVHPTVSCDMFPHCKFGDKCLFIHPNCKFGNTCTKRDCPYWHSVPVKATVVTPMKLLSSPFQYCKFFPNCTNISCQFYHPKTCKYGKFCKNKTECPFLHSFVSNKSSLSWRSK